MATQFARRYIIVPRADLAAAANLAAKQPDTDPAGGDRTFTVGLSATGSAPAQAYWCNWALTNAQAAAIRNRLQERGATVAETTPVPPGGTPASNRFAVFDAADWTPEAILAQIGMQVVRMTP